ncbi:hypothetical protein EVAR_100290_1 [Eumeta japonica]|uniref:Uncharacterized protein n=1 Tax=Eumeta variegata TaxID=151549 RepID=A0A4C2A563_EUMVA|nr:hypothetical protein EVAR_100290_1 [Eumeta japonica]
MQLVDPIIFSNMCGVSLKERAVCFARRCRDLGRKSMLLWFDLPQTMNVSRQNKSIERMRTVERVDQSLRTPVPHHPMDTTINTMEAQMAMPQAITLQHCLNGILNNNCHAGHVNALWINRLCSDRCGDRLSILDSPQAQSQWRTVRQWPHIDWG